MPAFASRAGGSLTDEQIDDPRAPDACALGEDRCDGAAPPPYASPGDGDASRGARGLDATLRDLPRPGWTGGPHGGSIVDPTYLALVSDQALRTTVVAGRPDLGDAGLAWRRIDVAADRTGRRRRRRVAGRSQAEAPRQPSGGETTARSHPARRRC